MRAQDYPSRLDHCDDDCRPLPNRLVCRHAVSVDTSRSTTSSRDVSARTRRSAAASAQAPLRNIRSLLTPLTFSRHPPATGSSYNCRTIALSSPLDRGGPERGEHSHRLSLLVPPGAASAQRTVLQVESGSPLPTGGSAGASRMSGSGHPQHPTDASIANSWKIRTLKRSRTSTSISVTPAKRWPVSSTGRWLHRPMAHVFPTRPRRPEPAGSILPC